MKITFHGATKTVTGSMHQVDAAGKTFLMDCGLFQGPRQQAREINTKFNIDPRKLDMLILSHAHTDHCGNLPNLVKQGFNGPILCTRATAAITAHMLLDSAKIQEEDAAYLNQKTHKSWQGRIEPLYTQQDALRTIGMFRAIPYNKPTDISGGSAGGQIMLTFQDAGHTLGSAAIRIQADGKTLVFSGDVGRFNAPVLNDPVPFEHADVFISECTYGGRKHAPVEQAAERLAETINRTVDRGGMLMMPAFALGRTQALVQLIHQLRNEKKIPRWLPVYVDAPLATRITGVYREFDDLLDAETNAMLEPFDFENLFYVKSVDESRKINSRTEPFIVIAGSGMCESGRILHHFKHHIRDRRNTIILPGFQAVGTLGRKIQDGWETLPIFGDMIPLNCQVSQLHGLSAHADGSELIEYSKPLLKTGNPHVYLVHGEPTCADAHRRDLYAAGFQSVTIPSRGDTVEV